MFKRVLCTTMLAAGFFVITADSGNAPTDMSGTLAGMTTDDPFPCPECDPNDGNGPPPPPKMALMTDDPFPCPECDPNDGNGPPPPPKVAGIAMDDPFPCPECDPNDGNGPPPPPPGGGGLRT
jgi:hypothetical protein